jgi:hypothetical protein
MNSKLLCLLKFVTVSMFIKPTPSTSMWGGSLSVDLIFKIMLGSKENSHQFLSFYKKYSNSNVQNNKYICTNVQMYITSLPSH